MIGSIDSPVGKRLAIRTISSVEVVDLPDVVRIAPLESGFWRRLDGSIDFGFNFAQADSLTQLSLNATGVAPHADVPVKRHPELAGDHRLIRQPSETKLAQRLRRALSRPAVIRRTDCAAEPERAARPRRPED